jgi:hypothetical protein
VGRMPGDRWLLAAIGTLATIVSMAFLLIRPVPLPDWLPGAQPPGWAVVSAGDPLRHGLARPFIVTPGDGQITVSWPSGEGLGPFRADAVAEDEAPTVFPCRQVSSSSADTSTCVVSGLHNGTSYLVSVHPADGADGSVPTRMARAVPRPALMASPAAVAWLDASDYDTIKPDQNETARIGSKVAALNDKSPHHYEARQPEAAREPTLGQLGKQPALLLDGEDVLSMDDSGFPAGNTPSTVLVVAAQDDPSGDVTCFHNLLSWGTDGFGQARILHKGCGTSLAYAETWGTYIDQRPTKSWPVGQAALVTADFDETGTSVRLNGAFSYRWQAPASRRMNTINHGGVSIGGVLWDARGGWVGRIGEIIVFNRVLTPDEQKSMEQYLASKWQLKLDPRGDTG